MNVMIKWKTMIWIVLWTLIFICFCNLPYVSVFYRTLIDGESTKEDHLRRTYSSNNPNGFSVGNYDFRFVQGFFNTYNLMHPGDSVLYRNFRMVPWKFWRWHDYLTDPAYALPYAPPPPDAGLVERGGPPKQGGVLDWAPRGIYKTDSSGMLLDIKPYFVPVE